MNVHEFQAKQLFAQFGVPVPRGKEITSPEAGAAWAAELNTPAFVIKAQIHAGGRGKAGGVKITKDKAAVPGLVKELIGKTLITHQTGPKGREVRRLRNGDRRSRSPYAGKDYPGSDRSGCWLSGVQRSKHRLRTWPSCHGSGRSDPLHPDAGKPLSPVHGQECGDGRD